LFIYIYESTYMCLFMFLIGIGFMHKLTYFHPHTYVRTFMTIFLYLPWSSR
jgi:hypothetical protein